MPVCERHGVRRRRGDDLFLEQPGDRLLRVEVLHIEAHHPAHGSRDEEMPAGERHGRPPLTSGHDHNRVMSNRDLLLRMLDDAYQRKAWHGPNLRGSLRGVTAEEAQWRPAKGRHNIGELTVHCAY